MKLPKSIIAFICILSALMAIVPLVMSETAAITNAPNAIIAKEHESNLFVSPARIIVTNHWQTLPVMLLTSSNLYVLQAAHQVTNTVVELWAGTNIFPNVIRSETNSKPLLRKIIVTNRENALIIRNGEFLEKMPPEWLNAPTEN